MVFKKLRARGLFFAIRRLPEDKRATMAGLAMSGISKEAKKVLAGVKTLSVALKEGEYSNKTTRVALKLKAFVKDNKEFIDKAEFDAWERRSSAFSENVVCGQTTKADAAFLKDFKKLVKCIETNAMQYITQKFGVK